MIYTGFGTCPKCKSPASIELTGETYDCSCCSGLMWFAKDGQFCSCGFEFLYLHQQGDEAVNSTVKKEEVSARESEK
ncbi:MAG: hypothetical protein E6Q97_30150 [Desulfurellales bacterium]|nr:MAG: hypothetical protein E6Q97_30150 [Desulfurellales bacterium]